MRLLQSTKVIGGTCEICGKSSPDISTTLRVCGDCVRDRFDEAKPHIEAAHGEVRARYGLPETMPSDPNGIQCDMCGNACKIPEDGVGLCGIVENDSGKLVRKFGTSERGLLNWYQDSIPTNCVSAWCCAGSSGAGYPKWCRTPRGDIGYNNLAVFIGSCTSNCLFCQNSSFRELTVKGKPVMSARELAGKADEDVGCICYFGGDPASQMPFVIESARLALKAAEEDERILRVCLETNLSMNRSSLEEFAELSMKSGGGIKADLKSWSPEILYALSGIKYHTTYENFKLIGDRQEERPEVPFARASTLLVPGYVDEEEIRGIASFIADIDPTIPYSLLAFHPLYYMSDMPRLREEEANKFLEICEEEGLERARLGNPWLIT
ncbi:hypothetical protein AKJ44_00085 [candidate division MSBL1 archaeon SCGC-AAA261F17]|uniref:Radical SAM core domain-containing protein n=1 Tax=candidate division MSBL1 archaeon SCGC-AAA261F17 TaxID=1698274 RepID=A0A133V7V9_9EURY|nr:hypothetical protein AKJ44_00085 [candidate division MSBL1 archaeon SCGC-AAA261F17]